MLSGITPCPCLRAEGTAGVEVSHPSDLADASTKTSTFTKNQDLKEAGN